jgi:hypothetical protein
VEIHKKIEEYFKKTPRAKKCPRVMGWPSPAYGFSTLFKTFKNINALVIEL